ncbi:LysR family transcriptional regulator [Pseudobacillus wudalianchiensis]|uniref:Transcriptional regulator n=1 Tax=Pseudobacillus wudalianchiensis TaxID=1743143 RepID=A0A1B9ABM7_9BACI|nr:LysR family transcriptional regulator [Bacillus wudalianchiensis]OCA81248.1 transcriptional regulator [Bacillus wudalianchiensis]
MDQLLLVFMTVAEKKNFSRAAEELHMTQPAVSQCIQTLERTVGSRLLDRTNKYVRLNKAGEIVYHHAKEITGLYTKMQCLVDDLTNKASGELSIGASYSFGEYVLPHIIAYAKKHYPLIKPVIKIGNTKEIERSVANRQLDVGIIEGEFQHERLVFESFAEDKMYVVAAAHHHLAGRKSIKLAELKEEMWIVREEGSGTREATEKMFQLLEQPPDQLMEFGSTQIIKESVEAGLGISLLSQWAIRKEAATGSLAILKVKEAPITRKFSLVTTTDPFQPKVVEILGQLLRNDFADTVPKVEI